MILAVLCTSELCNRCCLFQYSAERGQTSQHPHIMSGGRKQWLGNTEWWSCSGFIGVGSLNEHYSRRVQFQDRNKHCVLWSVYFNIRKSPFFKLEVRIITQKYTAKLTADRGEERDKQFHHISPDCSWKKITTQASFHLFVTSKIAFFVFCRVLWNTEISQSW